MLWRGVIGGVGECGWDFYYYCNYYFGREVGCGVGWWLEEGGRECGGWVGYTSVMGVNDNEA